MSWLELLHHCTRMIVCRSLEQPTTLLGLSHHPYPGLKMFTHWTKNTHPGFLLYILKWMAVTPTKKLLQQLTRVKDDYFLTRGLQLREVSSISNALDRKTYILTTIFFINLTNIFFHQFNKHFFPTLFSSVVLLVTTLHSWFKFSKSN
jgi:hypothetical protein